MAEDDERPGETGRAEAGSGARAGGFLECHRLVEVVLDEASILRRSPDIEHERAVAIYDLIENNVFALPGRDDGPYRLRLGLQENRRLVLDVRDEANTPLAEVLLPLTPLRRVIKDYFTVCESYFDAIRTATPSRIEAIDMGRRGLHNEGSDLLLAALAGRIEIDFQTARRLFTLVCVLHVRAQGR